MPAVFTRKTITRTELLTLGDSGSFTVKFRTPTFDEQMIDEGLIIVAITDIATQADARTAQVVHRLKSTIVDWSDLNDAEGKPIPFGWPMLEAMCVQVPSLIVLLEGVANELFVNPTLGDRLKNSDAASNASSERTNEAPLPETNSAALVSTNS